MIDRDEWERLYRAYRAADEAFHAVLPTVLDVAAGQPRIVLKLTPEFLEEFDRLRARRDEELGHFRSFLASELGHDRWLRGDGGQGPSG